MTVFALLAIALLVLSPLTVNRSSRPVPVPTRTVFGTQARRRS